MGQELDPVWIDRFRDIIITCNENRAPDPFMIWFRRKDAERFFESDFERVLTILIDARFDQRTTAENALENTIEVIRRGALKKLLTTSNVPSLIPRQNITAEQWADLFCSSLPQLRALSTQIVTQEDLDAAARAEVLWQSPAYTIVNLRTVDGHIYDVAILLVKNVLIGHINIFFFVLFLLNKLKKSK